MLWERLRRPPFTAAGVTAAGAAADAFFFGVEKKLVILPRNPGLGLGAFACAGGVAGVTGALI